MAARSIALFSIALSGVLPLACSGRDPGSPAGTGGGAGAGGAGAQGTGGDGGKCAVTPSAGAPAVFFRSDVMPIFGFSCAGSQCHSGTRPKAGLSLGPRCDPMGTDCVWPSQPNTDNPSAPQPITEGDFQNVYDALMAPSVTAPAVKRVVPGKPEASFLVDKIAGTQNDKGYACTNTGNDPTVGVCGDHMPQTVGPLCSTGKTGPDRVAAIVNWIAQGAANN